VDGLAPNRGNAPATALLHRRPSRRPGVREDREKDVKPRVPESSSIWPVHWLGDPAWIRRVIRNTPYQTAQTVYYTFGWVDYLYRLVRQYRPALAVETGVHFGRSSTAILAALHRNGTGRLISIDLPKAAPAANADGRMDYSHVEGSHEIGYLVPRELRDRWTLRLGDARELLPDVLADGVDLFLHDSDHSYPHQSFEYRVAWAALRPGGVLASDDTDWSAAWPELLQRVRDQYEPLSNGPGTLRAIRRTRAG
jgi:predicted O-methyltransferase YrrM